MSAPVDQAGGAAGGPHVDEQLAALALGTLPDSEAGPVEAHLAGCRRCREELSATRSILASLALDPEPILPRAAARDRLLAEVAGGGRLHRFAERVARLLDVTLEAAKAVLDSLDAPGAWGPLPVPGLPDNPAGVRFLAPPTGPRLAGWTCAALRIPAGVQFPTHTHLADEEVLVLQGGYLDEVSGREYHPGDLHFEPAGSTHSYRGLAGEDCYCIGVVKGHIRIGDLEV